MSTAQHFHHPSPESHPAGVRLEGLQSVHDAEVRRSSQRQTPDSSFGTLLRRGVHKSASAVERVAASAGYHIPGRAVVSAAIEGASAVRDAGGDAAGGGSESLGGGSASQFLTQRAQAGDEGAQLALATQQMQQANFANSVALLNMQTSIQNEAKQFSMVSNISKTRHESARNAIANIK